MDAFLLLSFGGPEGPDEVMPFLRNVTRGRGVPDERLAVVAEHYQHFGGVSPINAQNRALLAALEIEFHTHDLGLPLYWGNRNWAPYLDDTVEQMRVDGVTRAFVFATSATGGYSGCRQYRENLEAAQDGGAPEFVKLRHYFDHPGFIEANADAVRAALRTFDSDARLVFTAHSIPVSMNEKAGPTGGLYLAQQRETARLVAETVRGPGAEFDLVWQSRSGPPQVPWLEPDVNDHLRKLRAEGVDSVLLSPTGFVSDHLEVVVGSGQRGPGDRRRAGLTVRPRGGGRHPPGLREHDPGAGPGTERRDGSTLARGPRSVRHRLPTRVLPRPAGVSVRWVKRVVAGQSGPANRDRQRTQGLDTNLVAAGVDRSSGRIGFGDVEDGGQPFGLSQQRDGALWEAGREAETLSGSTRVRQAFADVRHPAGQVGRSKRARRLPNRLGEIVGGLVQLHEVTGRGLDVVRVPADQLAGTANRGRQPLWGDAEPGAQNRTAGVEGGAGELRRPRDTPNVTGDRKNCPRRLGSGLPPGH